AALDRVVALKMIQAPAGQRASPDLLARFRVEAQAVARLAHPNVVQIHEVGEHEGCPYLALEYVGGGSLAHKLAHTPQPARAGARPAGGDAGAGDVPRPRARRRPPRFEAGERASGG